MEIRAQDIHGKIDGSNLRTFQSTEQTGTGASQDVAHGLGQTPVFVIVFVTGGHNGAGAAGTQVPGIALGTHDATNCKVTCSAAATFYVVAF